MLIFDPGILVQSTNVRRAPLKFLIKKGAVNQKRLRNTALEPGYNEHYELYWLVSVN